VQYRTREQISEIAAIQPGIGAALSRAERLQRWAELLEQRGGCVAALRATEFLPWPERRAMRADDSALTVAFADPVLRAAGLASDRYEDGLTFFELTDDEAHLILCGCHSGERPAASDVAARARFVMRNRAVLPPSVGMPLIVSLTMAIGVIIAATL
jgi:hypothetical protein